MCRGGAGLLEGWWNQQRFVGNENVGGEKEEGRKKWEGKK